MNMLEECANVVNDRSFSPNDSPEWAPYYQGAFSRLRSTADGASRHQAETTNRRSATGSQMFDWACTVVARLEWTEKLSP
jgi:hypothetical protein